MRLPLRSAVLLGATIGILGMAGPFVAVTLLPGPFQAVMPMLLLAIPIVFQWPRRFDLATDHWSIRLLRRLVLVSLAAVVAAAVGWIEYTTIPSYSSWADSVHRLSLERAGKSRDEIEVAIAQHRQTPGTFAFENAVITAVPGTLAALVTLGVGAIAFRRRPAQA